MAAGGGYLTRKGRQPTTLTLVALIQNPTVIVRILEHLGLPVVRPAFLPARDPPLVFEAAGADGTWHD